MTRWRLRTYMAVVAVLLFSVSAVADSLLERLLRISGLTAAPGQMRSGDEDFGSIWIATLKHGTVTQLTANGGYHSPVFSLADSSLFAVKGDTVVQISLEGSTPTTTQKVPGIVKLVGFENKNPKEIVILLDSGSSPLAVLSLRDGKVTPLPYDAKSDGQRRMLAQIRGQERIYGTTSVYLKPERKQGLSRAIEWTDIYLKRGDATPQNVSRCDGVSCSQPALSSDGQRVAFVKTGG